MFSVFGVGPKPSELRNMFWASFCTLTNISNTSGFSFLKRNRPNTMSISNISRFSTSQMQVTDGACLALPFWPFQTTKTAIYVLCRRGSQNSRPYHGFSGALSSSSQIFQISDIPGFFELSAFKCIDLWWDGSVSLASLKNKHCPCMSVFLVSLNLQK